MLAEHGVVEPADDLVGETRDRTSTRLYSGLGDFQSGVLKLAYPACVRLEPRPSRLRRTPRYSLPNI